MFAAIAAGQAASSVLCAANSCRLILTDVGVAADVAHITPGAQHSDYITVLHRKVAPASASFTQGPAMTQQQCQQCMQAGADAVELACQQLSTAGGGSAAAGGSDSRVALCVGELGIGNTTAAAALLAALTGAAPEAVCGRGTGVDDAGLAAKKVAVAAGLHSNQVLISAGPVAALQAVGGLELAAMVGAFLAAARRGVPVIADGFVSGVAALVALRHEPHAVRRSLFLSHRSAERGAGLLIDQLGGVPPVLDMGMRLGEGTGAVLCLPILRSAAAVISNMASLEEVLIADTGDGA